VHRFAEVLHAELAHLMADCEDAVSTYVQHQAATSIQARWRGCTGRRRFDKEAKLRRQELQRTLADLQAELEMFNATVEAALPLVRCHALAFPYAWMCRQPLLRVAQHVAAELMCSRA
jgi:hypothetical protein